MSSQTVSGPPGGSSTTDRMIRVANLLYGAAGLLFLVGLYFDWQQPNKVLIQEFVVTSGSVQNSGLFILSILVLVVGFVISKVARFVAEYNREEFDQTQEWTVDVSSNKR